MKTPRRHSLLAAIAAGALLATAFTASADPAPKRDNDRQEQRKDKREQRQERRQDRREAKQERREDRREAKQDRRQERRDVRHDVRQDRREDRREVRQERRDDRQNVRARIARQQASQRAYQQRLNAERARQAAQRRAYANARHYSYYAPSYRYRYNYGGRWYDTSHYGAATLRRAVERGYQEGMRAGLSDRYGRYDYRRSRMWIDASYGFGGSYVSRSDYAHYFRQGFQRGYEDGFYGRGRYGHRVNGEAVIIQAVLEAILGFQRLG
jgi:hypothetical protein